MKSTNGHTWFARVWLCLPFAWSQWANEWGETIHSNTIRLYYYTKSQQRYKTNGFNKILIWRSKTIVKNSHSFVSIRNQIQFIRSSSVDCSDAYKINVYSNNFDSNFVFGHDGFNSTAVDCWCSNLMPFRLYSLKLCLSCFRLCPTWYDLNRTTMKRLHRGLSLKLRTRILCDSDWHEYHKSFRIQTEFLHNIWFFFYSLGPSSWINVRSSGFQSWKTEAHSCCKWLYQCSNLSLSLSKEKMLIFFSYAASNVK